MNGFLKIEQLAKAYHRDKPVFADVSFTVDKGEFVCIIGHSGCGKTTILNVLAGLDTASSGHAFMDGREISGPSLERGVVFQSHALMPWLTVRQNIAFAVQSRWPDWKAAQVNAHVEKHVAMVGLPHAIDKKPSQLSGGMKQRVGIARALALNPSFLVLDEPVSALDVSIQAQILNILQDMKERYGLSLLFISHDLSVVRAISDRVVVMYLGKICEVSPANELSERPLHHYTHALVSAVPIPDPTKVSGRAVLEGEPPSPTNPSPAPRS